MDKLGDIIQNENISVPLVAVYCGSRTGNNPIYTQTAFELGQKLAKAGFGLVYGGASIGVMGAVADGVLSQNGVAVGVIPQFMLQKEISHLNLTQLHLTDSMHTRKAMMAEYASAFVTLSGGFGTLEEIAEIATWRQLMQHDKPMMLLNTNQFYQHFIQHIHHIADEGFMAQQDRNALVVCDTADDVIGHLQKTVNIDNPLAKDIDTRVFSLKYRGGGVLHTPKNTK